MKKNLFSDDDSTARKCEALFDKACHILSQAHGRPFSKEHAFLYMLDALVERIERELGLNGDKRKTLH